MWTSPRISSLTLAAALLAGSLAPVRTEAKVRVVASTNDLASIAASVGGDQVEISAIARPTSDVHRVEALPSYMVRISRAQLYLKVGLGLDQWADAIIDGSRNSRLVVLDCSRDITALEKPTGKVDASMGDVHPNGNPHYWLDPRNGGIMAREIAEALCRLDPEHAEAFHGRAEAFAREAEEMAAKCAATVAAIPNREIVTYHRSWSYLANAWGLEVVANVEPVPGIPPTAHHLKSLVDVIQGHRVPVVLYEPYFSPDAGRFLERETGVRIATVSPSCESPQAGSYLAHFQQILDAITRSGPGGARP